MNNIYAERRLLRKLEKAWSRFEILINRLTQSDFNPFYHLGTLGIYLLVVLTITGIYLTIIYRPGAEVAYATVEKITGNWFGSVMRSVHRYASDAFLLVSILHALKTFLSDRFWGSRWLAWLTGWVMVIIGWAIGTMGYWLIWDVRSQWMTEVLLNNAGGGVALTFLTPEMASSSFAAFVIVLFVHIFLPLLFLFLVIVHILRLARGRLWSPRWVMVLSGAALVLVSVLKPVVSEAPADLGRFIENVRLDAWYLGFLPVLDRLGGWGFTLLTLGIFGVSIAMPWIGKGKQNGPAVIHESECNGCALCSSECPYRAIEMHYRADDTSRFKSIAAINAELCTGCGLCVGTCSTLGIELTQLPTDDVYENGLRKAVELHIARNEDPIVVFTCQRHASLGTLPGTLNVRRWENEAIRSVSPVFLGEWQENGTAYPTATCVLPCIGMADVDWIKSLNRMGTKDILLLGCPYDDCNYREGVQWESLRLRRRKAMLAPNMQWREAGPGDARVIPEMLSVAVLPLDQKKKPELPDPRERQKMNPTLPVAGVVLALFSILVALALPVDFLSSNRLAGQSQVRVLLEHAGVVSSREGNSSIVLPENSTVDLSQILSGVPFPVELQLRVDDALVLEDTYEAGGIRGDGTIHGMSLYNLEPGTYRVELIIRDDGTDWRTVFADEVQFDASQILTFLYDQEKDTFSIYK